MARVLIAEPDEEVRELFAHALSRLGHEAVGAEAVAARAGELDADALAAEDIDAALVEPAAPRLLELAGRLRARRPELGIVVVSIQSRTPATRALRPVAHLVKPFARRDLEDALRRALNGAATSFG